MTRALIALALVATLAACGSRTKLYPRPGMATVPQSANAERAQSAEELMRPSTQAQPDRQADLIGRSAERGDDPFDLPPGSNNADPAAKPAAEAPAVAAPENVNPDDNASGEGRPKEPTRTDPNAPDTNGQ